MKHPCRFAMLFALGISSGVAASAVAPQVTGTISRTSPMGRDTHILINGHTYVVNPQTHLTSANTPLQPGEKVTLFLGADRKTVVVSQAGNATPTHP
ncbi:MAG TPA: hypothetical protein VGN24_10205 [Rhodanobacter sp.]|jgi:hypothetical protein|nr:hypothetical protein [Rhodanobacter sp.]